MKPRLIKQFVKDQDIETLRQIVSDWNQFEKDGCIGDSVLRNKATEYMNEIGSNGVTTWMTMLTFETLLFLYH